MNDITLDLETMGTDLTGAIVGIGIVEFDLAQGTIGRTFFRAINLGDVVNNHGLTMDPSTVSWWLTQTKSAQYAITTNCYPARQALVEIAEFIASCGSIDNLKVWGCGPAFDNAMLAHLYNKLGLPIPWKFWNDRCVRTLRAFYPMVPKPEIVGEAHNAVDDAMAETKHLLAIREHVRSTRRG